MNGKGKMNRYTNTTHQISVYTFPFLLIQQNVHLIAISDDGILEIQQFDHGL